MNEKHKLEVTSEYNIEIVVEEDLLTKVELKIIKNNVDYFITKKILKWNYNYLTARLFTVTLTLMDVGMLEVEVRPRNYDSKGEELMCGEVDTYYMEL